MENQRDDKLTAALEEFRNSIGEKYAAKLELDKCIRIIQRLSSFSSQCEECAQHFIDIESHIFQLKDQQAPLEKDRITQHRQFVENITSHLQKQHKLITNGHYLSIYMSIGTSLGLVFGLIFYDNIALGLSFGMGIGVAIGAGLDADAKKKGLVL